VSVVALLAPFVNAPVQERGLASPHGGDRMRFRDREERERYMDNLERQMEGQREQIQHTLDRIEDSGRRWAVPRRLWNSLPSFPGRTRAQDAGESHERVAASSKNPEPRTPPGSSTSAQESSERPWWRRVFGG